MRNSPDSRVDIGSNAKVRSQRLLGISTGGPDICGFSTGGPDISWEVMATPVLSTAFRPCPHFAELILRRSRRTPIDEPRNSYTYRESLSHSILFAADFFVSKTRRRISLNFASEPPSRRLASGLDFDANWSGGVPALRNSECICVTDILIDVHRAARAVLKEAQLAVL